MAERSNAADCKSVPDWVRAVRIPQPPRTPRVVQRANPASRRQHLLRSQRTVSSQGANKPVRYKNQNGIERDIKAEGVERDGISTRKYNQMKRCKFRIRQLTRWAHVVIGSSVRPRETREIIGSRMSRRNAEYKQNEQMGRGFAICP